MKRRLVAASVLLLVLFSRFTLVAAEQHSVRVGAFNYYPAIFMDKDGSVKGFYVDALDEIGKRENIRFEYVYGSWSEGLERIKNGEVELLTSVAYTPERAGFLDYADMPLLTVWGELYVPLSSAIDGIRAVQGKKVAVMKGDVNGRHFIELTQKFAIDCEFVELPGFDAVFAAVADHKVDAGVVNSTFGVASQKEYGLRSTGVVFNPFDIFFAVAKGQNRELLNLLDSYFGRWRHQADSPYNRARHKWAHGSSVNFHVIPHWLVNTLAALAGLVLVASLFIFLLKRQVRRARNELQQREQRLMESELAYRTLSDSGPALVWTSATDMLCDSFNKIWLQFTGRSLEQEVGNGWADGVHPDDFKYCLDTYTGAFEKRESFIMEYRLRRHDGEYRWLQDYGCPRYSLAGEFSGYIGYCLDIDDRKKAEKELQARNIELEQFTYTVSHDLKSPLITIKGFSGALEKDLQAGKFTRMPQDLQRISSAADKMNELLRDLLALSTVGRIVNNPQVVDMNLLVAEVLEQMSGPLQSQNLKVVVQDGLPEVFFDRQRLAEVIQNLLENSIKYMGNQAEPLIEFGCRSGTGNNVYFVKDNGIGIDPRYQQTIFGLFNKLDANSDGTGVGLALVKRIVEVHGGRIWVESAGIGAGSIFCFTLSGAEAGCLQKGSC